MKTTDPKLIAEAIDLLNQTKSLDHARTLMHKLIEDAKTHLDKHFSYSQTRQLLKQLADFGIKRKK